MRTRRTDLWWWQPLMTFVALTAFVAYGLFITFVDRNYFWEPYLSPFFSPCLTDSCPASVQWQSWPVGAVSPALIVLVFPLGFRATCYYYRKAYYRSFWLSPPACAVAEPHRRYTGETRFPLILQNVHRYFFYFGVLFAAILTYDVVIAFRDHQGHWGGHAGGLGTLLLLINAVLIWGGTRWAAIRAGTSPRDGSTTSPGTRSATAGGRSSPCSTRAMRSGRGRPSYGSP